MPGSPSPTESLDAIKHVEWQIAQEKLSKLPWSVEAYKVERWDVKWRESDGPFYCGNVWANGCHIEGTIVWNIQTPTVIRHEAGHAILYKLKDPRYKEYEH